MNTVARVAGVAEEGIYIGNMDDHSGFHNLSLHPKSWPLFRVSSAGTDAGCTITPFGWNESPMCSHSFSDAKAAYLGAPGIPTLTCVYARRLVREPILHVLAL